MADYSVFASKGFDPNDYANAILAGEPYPPTVEGKLAPAKPTSHLRGPTQDSAAKEDISVAISKLTFGIEDVSKQIRNLVTAHHEDLLTQASNANALSGALTSVRSGLSELDASVEKLRLKVHVPYETLQTLNRRLQKLRQASDILRRVSRFVTLARRLQTQMNEVRGGRGASNPTTDDLASATIAHGKDIEDVKERAIAKAALTIAEITTLLDDGEIPLSASSAEAPEKISLRAVTVVAAQEPFIDDARAYITGEMETMVLAGLQKLNQTLLASSLQTAYNLGVLPNLVSSLLLDLSQAVEDRIRITLDLSQISKDAGTKEPVVNSPRSPQTYRSRIRTEPTATVAPQWATTLWARVERMFAEMADCCIKVYALEKILKVKKDPVTQTVFLDEAMTILENRPSSMFWITLSRSLQKYFQDSMRSSPFLQQTLANGYPRLLRQFHEFFAKISVHTDTVYSDSYQSPETIVVLRAVGNIESQYLSKVADKIVDSVSQSLSGGRTPVTAEGINLTRTIANELDGARFDPVLVKATARTVVTSLADLLNKVELLISRDRAAVSFTGTTATPQQVSNAGIVNFLYQTWSRLSRLDEEHTPSVLEILRPSVEKLKQLFDSIVDPITLAVRRELNSAIAKLHRVDFSKSTDPNAGLAPSFYVKELTEKTTFIKSEIINRYNLGDWGKNWTTSVAKGVIRAFIVHISIASPLGEAGKLQMATDMTGLEFALNGFIADAQNKRGGNLESIGEEYRALRAMRPLFFLDNQQLASKAHTGGLRPLIILHHILVRSPIPLPHQLHGWQEAEYVRWVEEHSEEEAWSLVEGGLTHWEQVSDSEGRDVEDALEYIQLARIVLGEAKAGQLLLT